MKAYRTASGVVVARQGEARHIDIRWDDLFAARDDTHGWLAEQFTSGARCQSPADILAPIGSQEVWAAGVTYWRSRTARMEESKKAGGGSFYDLVYNADRPELFFKAAPHRVVGPGQPVRIRSDSNWNVPEPELTLAVSASGAIIGYTIGNDVSSREIEGANPLYLPQAKCYVGSCALGPCILLPPKPLDDHTPIALTIRRGGEEVFGDVTTLAQMRRRPAELVSWLFRANAFPSGCFLMTGTGIIPPDDFTLGEGDEVEIEIGAIGTLVNSVVAAE